MQTFCISPWKHDHLSVGMHQRIQLNVLAILPDEVLHALGFFLRVETLSPVQIRAFRSRSTGASPTKTEVPVQIGAVAFRVARVGAVVFPPQAIAAFHRSDVTVGVHYGQNVPIEAVGQSNASVFVN